MTPPAAGIFAALVAFLAAHLAVAHDSPLSALLVLSTAILLAAFEFRGVFGHQAKAGIGNERSANLIATRGTPRVWLVAHVDSKSQTIPMLLRVASVLGMTAGTALLFLVFIAGIVLKLSANADLAPGLDPIVVSLTLLVVISSLPLAFCWIGNRSPGALDNASGVAAVLLVAEATPRDAVGILISSAEEVGLAGSRAFAASQGPGVAINCDTVDDHGQFVALRGGSREKKAADALLSAARRSGIDIRSRGSLPGVVTDGTALAQAGWDVVTLSRGNLATLTRVHTSRDTAERINGTGIALAARLLTATIEELA